MTGDTGQGKQTAGPLSSGRDDKGQGRHDREHRSRESKPQVPPLRSGLKAPCVIVLV
jgi:hypothetical protein